jgi:hypothetical protein
MREKSGGLIVFIIVFFLSNAGIGQVKNITIASPNAASLGKFVDIPVNYHTGVPEISIPIYTVKQGPLTMPISLSYHAGGLRVAEQASWVGAGWALNAGGVVTRSPRGGIDEKAAVNKSYLKDMGYFNYLYSGSVPGQLAYMEFSNGQFDGEPDLFTFNFNGYGGKFYFRPDGTPVLVPQQDIAIKPLYCKPGVSGCTTTNEYLFGWVITTPDGVKYYFGKTTDVSTDVDPAERTQTYSFVSGASFSESFSSWYLYKVESPDGNSMIALTYAAEDYGFYSLATYPLAVGDAGNGTGMDAVKNLVQGVRLNSITFSNGGNANGTISFIPETTPREDLSSYLSTPTPLHDNSNTNAKALKRIEISTNSICTAFEMSYSYFADNASTQPSVFSSGAAGIITSDRKRLKLNSVQEKSCDNTLVKPAHSFTYYDETSVPRTVSLAVDHWGYYNGATSNTTLIPPLSTNGGYFVTDGGAANRESKWPEMRAGTLQSIKYPTGGTVDITYKNHSAFVEKAMKVVEWSDTKSETLFRTSAKYLFTVSTPTYFQLKISKPNGGDGGTAYLNCTTNSANTLSPAPALGSSSTSPQIDLIVLQPGNYEFYVVSGDNTSYRPIEATLTKYNSYQQYEEVVVGGLRVETTSLNDDVNAVPLVTNYSYTNDLGVAQGVLYSRPNYIALARNNRLNQSGLNGAPPAPSNGCITNGSDYRYFISAGSIHPMTTSQGNHVGYNQVKVSSASGGYSLYQYTTGQNSTGDVSIKSIDKTQCDPFAPNFPPAPELHNFYRGLLRRTAVYNSSDVLLKETFSDPEFTNETVGVNGLIVKFCSGTGLATEYELKTAKKTKSTEVELTYDPTDPSKQPFGVVRETIFNSPNHAMPNKEIIYELTNWNSATKVATKGIVLNESRKTYVADIQVTHTTSPCNTAYSCDQTLTNALSQHLATYTAAKAGCGSNTTCIWNAWQTYTLNVNTARIAYVTCRDNYYQCLTNAGNLASIYNAAGAEVKALLDLKRQNNISPVIETSAWRDGKFMNSSYITYQMFEGNSNYIFPGRQEVIKTSAPSPSTDFVPVSNTNTIITKDVDYKEEETYTFNGGNIAEIIGKNGVRTAYLWGYNSTEPVAQVINAKQNQIYYNSFETAGGIVGDAKTGSKYLASGSYVIPYTPPADGAIYKMSYWYWSASKWNFSGELPFSSTITNGTQLDEIRVYPLGANVTTYTYDIGKGVTSITDHNGLTSYFEYDKLGRFTVERDDTKKIKRNYGYYYKDGGN